MLKVLTCSALCVIGGFGVTAEDWPSFRGVNHQGVSTEKGLLDVWPESGPQQLWRCDGIGDGYSSACVVNDEVYVTGMIDLEGWISKISSSGKLVWKKKYGATASEKKLKYKGPRTTPRYDDGLLYIYSAAGTLFCFSSENGDVVWSKDIAKEYASRDLKWKYTESLLIVGDKVICTPGGEKSLILALNKKTGTEIWNNNELERKAAYCSPTLIDHNGRKIILTNIGKSSVGIDPANGKLLWEIPLAGKYGQNQVTPLYHEGKVFITNARGAEPSVFEISADGASAKVVWKNKVLENNFGGVVLHNGYLYGTNKKGWVCQEFATGKEMWTSKGSDEGWMHKSIKEGSVILADDMLYAYSYSGLLALIKPDSGKLNLVSKVLLPESSQGKMNYSHPAISNKKLYIRHGDAMIAYAISK